MLAELLALFNGRFDPDTFVVKVYPISENLDESHQVPDNYSISRVAERDMIDYSDVKVWFYYRNISAMEGNASFTLIFKRSDLALIPNYEMGDFFGVVAYNTNQTLLRAVTPNPVNWLRMTGEPFSVN